MTDQIRTPLIDEPAADVVLIDDLPEGVETGGGDVDEEPEVIEAEDETPVDHGEPLPREVRDGDIAESEGIEP